MVETILKIDRLVCGLCEAHVDQLIRNHFEIQKVKSNHRKSETKIISEQPLDQNRLTEIIEADGYRIVEIQEKQLEKKGGLKFRL